MNDAQKLGYQMATTTDLAYWCQLAVEREKELKQILKHKSIDDSDYQAVKAQRSECKQRIKYLRKELQKRQMRLF